MDRVDDVAQDVAQDVTLQQEPPGGDAGRLLRVRFWKDVATTCGLPGGDDGPPGDDEDLAAPGGAFWVARRGGRPVGCVGVRLLDGGDAEVKRLYVDPAARGLGLAHRLMTTAEDWARERRAPRLVLDTHAALTAALRLYEREGFAQVERYNDNPDAQLWFAKPL
ncbi:GNAT family N-acetyltransferase [Kineococcus gypseus]|uniref:GNAT family N-acetyltransferase n=1 Tax=Kineococcus gypseus TaxID=1637102 RepID=UPI003D7F1790